MNGSPMSATEQRQAALAATSTPPPDGDYTWDELDEDECPLSKEEMRTAIKNKGGRPRLATPKEHITLRMDADIVTALRASGKGWQTRVNAVMRAWLEAQETQHR